MKKLLPALALCALMLVGCSSSYMTSSTNVSQEKKTYDKILVVAKTKNKTARIRFEDQVVADLGALGVNAASSMDVIKVDSFDKQLTEKELDNLRSNLVASGYDGIIVTNLVDASQYTDVIPGGVGTSYVPTRYGRFGRYYGYYPVSYWEPDQVRTGVQYVLESALYDMTDNDGQNLQWVGQFKVKDPGSINKTVEKYSKELTAALKESSVQ